jgi:hypothetical protein
VDLETLKLILPVAGTLLGAIVGGLSTYLITNRSLQHQEARALREAKRTRLASIYEATLIAVIGMDHFASVHHIGESSAEQLADVFTKSDLARARLMVEPDAGPVAEEFEQLFRAFTALRVIESQKMDPQIRLTDVHRRQDEFARQATALREAIHASLRPLDYPVSRPWWRFW